jgi:hypothetical protein
LPDKGPFLQTNGLPEFDVFLRVEFDQAVI